MPRREQLEEMLKDEPEDVFLNYALAKSLAEGGDPEAAIEQFRRTLSIDADHVPSYFQMAQTMAAAGQIEEARATTQSGLDVARKVGDDHAAMEMTEFLQTL